MVKKHLIYALSDPRTDEVRYIGRSSSWLKRAKRYHGARCGNWLKNLKLSNLEPVVDVLEEFDATDNVNEILNTAERYWISYWRFIGANLTNMTDGGEGSLGCKSWSKGKTGVFSQETIDSIRKSLTGRKDPPHVREKKRLSMIGEKNHRFGKPGWNRGMKTGPRSIEVINKIKETRKKNNKPPWNKGKSSKNI